MLSQEVRHKFLHYFHTHSHTIVPSSSVIPHDDPSLLFINAGMNQFKDVFLGKNTRPYKRATSTQKCIRAGGKHNDLENVGHTARHLTFFEMLGNFSFGDYFKKEAIGFAYDVAIHLFNFDPKRLWASVFHEDEEAFALWEKHLPPSRIIRLGERDNFWAMGETGPCGPCSELLYDRGEKYTKAPTPLEDENGERFLEFWNLVFMQYNRDENGVLSPLPKQSIDTGAGLERILYLMIEGESIFETDILRSLISKVEEMTGKTYDPSDRFLAPSFHVIADHIRALAFAIADGAQPSNIERGYVLRKILRRAVRYARKLEITEPFLAQLLPTLIQLMGKDFPELKDFEHQIGHIITLEEESFFRTLHQGGNILQHIIERTEKTISGEDAFRLKDTYGFPIEEIVLIAKDYYLEVDLATFYKLEEQAKERSRHAQRSFSQQYDQNLFSDFGRVHGSTKFLGYEKTECEAQVQAIVIENTFVDEILENKEGMILLNQTPFYAEQGGQVGDTGFLSKEGFLFEVYDTISPYDGVIAHVGKMIKGHLKKGDHLLATIEKKRRQSISNNHTATHLLHWALEQLLGDHIRQSGSIVEEERFRFDFNHHKAVTLEELEKIEDLVNEKIREDTPVTCYQLSLEEARKDKKIKQFFQEMYGKSVRVIDIRYSKELCGGTHVQRLGQIGLFKILKESSISAGVRRIEATTGRYAEKFLREKEQYLSDLAHILRTSSGKLKDKIITLLEDNKELTKQIKQIKKQGVQASMEDILKQQQNCCNIPYLITSLDCEITDLPLLADEILAIQKSDIVILSTEIDRRCHVLIKISSDLVQKEFYADELIKLIAPLIKGGGGGKKQIAQAGGTDASNLNQFDAVVRKYIEEKC